MLLAANVELELADTTGKTALLAAVQGGHTAIADALIDAGASMLHADKNGNTCLHWAAATGHRDLTALLLRKGAFDVNAPNHRNDTPYALAVREGHGDVAQLLASAGAVASPPASDSAAGPSPADSRRRASPPTAAAGRSRRRAADQSVPTLKTEGESPSSGSFTSDESPPPTAPVTADGASAIPAVIKADPLALAAAAPVPTIPSLPRSRGSAATVPSVTPRRASTARSQPRPSHPTAAAVAPPPAPVPMPGMPGLVVSAAAAPLSSFNVHADPAQFFGVPLAQVDGLGGGGDDLSRFLSVRRAMRARFGIGGPRALILHEMPGCLLIPRQDDLVYGCD